MWEIVNGPKLSCYRIALRVARSRLKSNPDQPPLVIFHGPKPAWPNNQREKLNFYLRRDEHGNEMFDFYVDPTFAGNPPP